MPQHAAVIGPWPRMGVIQIVLADMRSPLGPKQLTATPGRPSQVGADGRSDAGWVLGFVGCWPLLGD